MKKFLVVFLLTILSSNTAFAFASDIESHSGVISQRTVWSADKVHLIEGNVRVTSGVELSIEPGTVIKFKTGTNLQVDGALNAVGSSNARIYFTSFRDDSVGGDTNQDGYSQGQAGDWSGLYFTDTVADNLTKLAYIENRFAGRSSTAAIRLYNAS
ncbi:hypothetical protein JQC92_13250, partial [Shewanella sp. 202IG2-18]|uniref:hypothetical protein n=1 Tax=Parashewanella hymeniacidonis TaxID=2807618 RepID=UPI0019620798